LTQKIQSIVVTQLEKNMTWHNGFSCKSKCHPDWHWAKGWHCLAPQLLIALKHPYYTIIDLAVPDVLRSQQLNRERTHFPSSRIGSSERCGCDHVALRPAVQDVRIQSHQVLISLNPPFLSSIEDCIAQERKQDASENLWLDWCPSSAT